MMNFIPYFEESGTYWNVMVSSENRKHVSRSTMIKAKNMTMQERIGSIESLREIHCRKVSNEMRVNWKSRV